jgi:hypothetical protein
VTARSGTLVRFGVRRVGVVGADLAVGGVAIDHRIHVAGGDAEEQVRLAERPEIRFAECQSGWLMMPTRKPCAFEQAADQRHAEARVVDVGVAGDQDDVARIPAERVHFGARHGQEGRRAETAGPVLAAPDASAPSFPVDYAQAGARIEFDLMTPDKPQYIAGINVTPKKQLHAGDSYGYRFESLERTVVYSTDSEHRLDDPAEHDEFVAFFAKADLVIFDAMYSLAEAVSVKADWGHSSNVVGVELCQAAAARRLALFHHEPVHDDKQLSRLVAETRRLEQITRGSRAPLEIISAYDGLTIEL